MEMKTPLETPIGKALVVGGGIGGVQCALDLADAGFYVYLLEKSHTLGGTMARLDKTFPTNDCSTCMFSPRLAGVAGHANIEIITLGRLLDLEGEPGRFTARVEKRPRYISEEKCISCGQCAEKCPKKVPDEFNGELGKRKAAFLTFPQAAPLKYALDPDHCLYLTRKRCGVCEKICPAKAVEFDQQPEILELSIGAVVVSTGFELALTEKQGEFGFGRYKNVVTSLQYERILSATGPFGGNPRRPSDGATPGKVAWIQCVMSRDPARNRPFCSSVCCMHAAKQAVLTRSHEPGTEAVIYFMDVRAHGKGFDDYVERARIQHGVRYRRSMISQVYLNPENDNLIIETFDHHLNRKIEEEYNMVVLSSGLRPSSDFNDLASRLGLAVNAHGFLSVEFDEPGSTSRPGVYVCGAAETPKD
ncbi:MAG: CoB--CoM heterodisulfide reductase iron-sulfur subunit A family protein, partial [Desulfobacterales bacterium]|nr:CoB--CoM heterodisulfide reductase iron-sulfur subunit A family protein [Desulfobacterales bacterium]